MKRTFLLLITLAAIATAIVVPIQAQNLTLKQQLVPIDCVFESINDGLGTINYLTPEECGQIIPPVQTTDPSPDDSLTPNGPKTPTGPVYVRTSEGKQDTTPVYDVPGESTIALLLNSIAEARQASGYRVKVSAGDTLFYRPLDDPKAAVRSITIAGVDHDSVWWEIRPLGLNFDTVYGETEFFDSLKTKEKAVSLKVASVNSDGSGDIIIRLYAPELAGTTTTPKVTVAILVLLLLGCVSILRFRPEWLGDIKK